MAFSCCQRRGHQYENGALVNIGSACRRDRCVDGSWHVIRREHVVKDPCAKGWERDGHRCVARVENGTWHEGEQRCQSHGAEMLTVASKSGWNGLAQLKYNATVWLGEYRKITFHEML